MEEIHCINSTSPVSRQFSSVGKGKSKEVIDVMEISGNDQTPVAAGNLICCAKWVEKLNLHNETIPF